MRLKKASIFTWIVFATLAGVIAGWVIGPEIGQIKFLGDLFIRLVQMSVVILVMGVVIEAVGSLTPQDLGRVGLKTIGLFAVFVLFSGAVGVLVANVFQPGVGITGFENLATAEKPPETKWIDMIVNFVPKNVVEAMAQGNMVQAIVFSLLFGLALNMVGERGKKILDLISDLNAAITKLITMVIYTAPVGIFAIMANVTGTVGIQVLIPMAKFLFVFGVAIILVFVVVTLIACSVAKVSPITYVRKCSRMVLIAVTTTSSAVTFPVQVKDSEELLGIGKKTSRLVFPLGMTMNSDGAAIHTAVAMVTIAQFFGITLGMDDYVKIVLVSALLTVGTIVVPGAGFITLTLASTAVGLPLEGVALLIGIDWFCGILRTFLNVMNDTSFALWVAATEKDLDRDVFHNRRVAISETTL